jgi:septum formation protein
LAEVTIVLASASARRRELLSRAGLAFEVAPADVEEDLGEFGHPAEAALELARRKARAGAAACAAARENRRALVLGADTIVAVDSAGVTQLLGKAENEAEARRMLRLLSGSRHQVITGVCVFAAPGGGELAAFERTWVTMRPIEPAELEAYVASGEWRGKAGAYAIQESADRFVTRLEEGGFDNVVGLPVALTLELLERARAGL